MILKILSLLIVAIGAIVVFGAKTIVEKYKLNEKSMVDFEYEMSEEEITDYKNQRALLNVKIIGMIIALPGLIMVLMFFK